MPTKMNEEIAAPGIITCTLQNIEEREYPKSFDKKKNCSVKKVENKNGIIFSVVTLETRNY